MPEKINKTEKKRQADLSNVMYGKIPPQATDLEHAVLGGILIDKNAIFGVVGIVAPESFYDDRHRLVFEAIIDLYTNRHPIDLLTVTDQLRKMGKLEEAGGPFYITSLCNSVATGEHIVHHAKIVQQKYLGREMIRIGTTMVHDAYEDTTDVFEMIENTQKQIFELNDKIFKKSNIKINYLLDAAIEQIDNPPEATSEFIGVESGFKSFDKVTLGQQPGRLYIVAARPGMGKTSFTLQLARNAAINKVPTAFFSLEMNSKDLVQKLISVETEIKLEDIQYNKLTPDEKKHMKSALQELRDSELYIDDSTNISVFELVSKCRQLKQQADIQLVVIDYLQLMSGEQKGKEYNNTEEEISYISKALKNLSKDIGVPVIALSQLSRELEKRADKHPILSDLRSSGSIEQDADLVIFLYRPEYYGITQDKFGNNLKGVCEVNIAKNRHGKLAELLFNFKGEYTKFFERT